MKDRSLKALGLDDVPAKLPLTYPGRPATEPALLSGDELWPLDVRRQRLGGWPVSRGPRLDEKLRELGQVGAGLRHPVIAVGSNASPGQVSHKLTRLGIPATVPMVPVQIQGVGIGCSGHISPAGYVAGTPYIDRSARATLVVTWLDATQLKAVDDTEFPDYRRAILPGDEFDMVMPSGERLGGAYIYFSAHGVLAGPDGRPRPGGGDQSELLAALLAESEELRQLLGPDPATWVAKAGADPAVRQRGTEIFGATGRVLPQNEFLPYLDDSGDLRFYDDLPPLAGSLPSPA
ncbi:MULTISPECIES: hypothetical protein [Streptomyces]